MKKSILAIAIFAITLISSTEISAQKFPKLEIKLESTSNFLSQFLHEMITIPVYPILQKKPYLR